MGIHISALMNNADHLHTIRCNQVEHRMPSLRKAAIASLHVIPFPAETRIGRQFVETIEDNLQVGLGLLDSPLLDHVNPDRLHGRARFGP